MQTITAIHTSGIKLFRNFKKLNPNVIFISIKYEIIKLILYEIIAFLATVLISPNTIPSTIPIRVVDEDKTPVIKRFSCCQGFGISHRSLNLPPVPKPKD